MVIENVFSGFDGMSCGQIVLQEEGVFPKKYFASEIDKHAIKATKYNYVNTIHVGDITKVDPSGYPKIDLMLGGFPCQGFSINGKGLNFEDSRSQLLFKLVYLKMQFQPRDFIFECVATMTPAIKAEIDKIIGVEGVYMNSNLFCAQNRKRIYWTNIKFTPPSENKTFIVKDILDDHSQNISLDISETILKRQYFSSTTTDGVITLNPKFPNGKQTYQQDRIYDCNGRYIALTATLGNRFNIKDQFGTLRKLSIKEQMKLQTIPEYYSFAPVSDLNASKLIGNGWTIKAIRHILKHR
jgi:DNA (cytosine-5)-methyltransferase 3A